MIDVIVVDLPDRRLDPGTGERVLELFRRGAITDDRLVELYQQNAHFWVSWPNIPPHIIIKHRERLSNQLRLTSVMVDGVHMHAVTEYLAAAS